MSILKIIKHFFLSTIIAIMGLQVLSPQCLAESSYEVKECEKAKRVGASFAEILLKYKAEDLNNIHSKLYREIKELAEKDYNACYGIYQWKWAFDPNWQSEYNLLRKRCFREGFLKEAKGRVRFHARTIVAIFSNYDEGYPEKVDLKPVYSDLLLPLAKLFAKPPAPPAAEIQRVVRLFINELIVWRSHPSESNRLSLLNAFKNLADSNNKVALEELFFYDRQLKKELATVGFLVPQSVVCIDWFYEVFQTQDLHDLTLMSSPAQMINEIKRINGLLKEWELNLKKANKQVQAQLIRKIRQTLPGQWSFSRLFSKAKFLNDRYEARKLVFSEVTELMPSLDLENKEALLSELVNGREQYVPQIHKHKHDVLTPSEETLEMSKKFITKISAGKQKGHWKNLLNMLEGSLGEAVLKVQLTRKGTKNNGFARANIALTLNDGRGFHIQHLGHLRQGTTVPLQNHQLEFEFDFSISASDEVENLADKKTWFAPFFAALEAALANDSTVQQRLMLESLMQQNEPVSTQQDATGVRISCEDELLDQAAAGNGDGVESADAVDSSGAAGNASAAKSSRH